MKHLFRSRHHRRIIHIFQHPFRALFNTAFECPHEQFLLLLHFHDNHGVMLTDPVLFVDTIYPSRYELDTASGYNVFMR